MSSSPLPSHLAADAEVVPLDTNEEKIDSPIPNNGGDPVDAENRVSFASPQDISDATSSPESTRTARQGLEKANDKRHSSAQLRRDIPDSLLAYDHQGTLHDDLKYSILDNSSSTIIGEEKRSCFRRIFFNPSYPLQRQMMLSFGTVSSLCILLVMIISIVATVGTGFAIKKESSDNVNGWVDNFMGSTSRLAAEALSPKILPHHLVNLMVEIARDRFAGYPSAEDDSETPFFDTLSQQNVYPLQNNPLPLDWDFRHTTNEMGNVNNETQVEHVQGRYAWYSTNPRLSTISAMYTMQGACDPRVSDPSSMVYYPNCTEANNNLTTGGIVSPSPTNEQIYRKAADLSPYLKALYEANQDIRAVGYFFSNSGSGSSLFFPHQELDSSSSYESVGCEWMRTVNPIDPNFGPIGSEEEIAKCHPEGTDVPTREYNPLERAWCRDQALNSNRVQSFGPFLSAWSDTEWLMAAGRALYDHGTGSLVACVLVEFSVDGIAQIHNDITVDELGVLTLVRNDEVGTVAASPYFDFDTANETTTIDDPALKTGVDQDTFAEIKSLVNFSLPWKPEEASESFETTFFDSDENIIAAYPIPSIPEEYSPEYQPEFFVILSWPKEGGLASINEKLGQEVDDKVWDIIQFTIIIGAVGLLLVFIFIIVTASWFVVPLKWMSQVGDQVLENVGEESNDASIDYKKKEAQACSPNTEFDSLVGEFQKMISQFSGCGSAKKHQIHDVERFNAFEYADFFADLYKGRLDERFAFKYLNSSPHPGSAEHTTLSHCNLGHNTQAPTEKMSDLSASDSAKMNTHKIYKSPFFHWMIGTIVIPLLIITIVISVAVLTQISIDLPTLIEPIKEEYTEIKDLYRSQATELLAVQASAVMEKASRDTHLLTRFASWLYFEGMNISGSFTDMIEGAEECKTAPSAAACEWKKDFPCDCAWNDISVRGKQDACMRYSPGESRAIQKLHFEAQSQDTEANGSSYFSSYPEVAYSPNTTAWWDNITSLPQSSYANTRYETTYDRVLIVSALSSVMIPLYNYDTSNDKPFGIYIGFEADGMLAGYRGCDAEFVSYPFWMSSENNGAAKLRPELCPIGKYGYDARCRSWFADGKAKAMSGNGTLLHITAPYIFAEGGVIGQSITSPLIDSANKYYVGQVLIDFFPNRIYRSLEKEDFKLGIGGFPFMVTPDSDVLGHDVVVGPGFSFSGGDGKSIKELVDPDESFDHILRDMKSGGSGSGSFFMGENEVRIAYAPVVVRNTYPVDSSDIARGVKAETTLVYSLALVETEDSVMHSFQSIVDSTSRTVRICIGVLTVLIAISVALIVWIAISVTSSITEPILQLLDVLRDINRMRASNVDMAKIRDFERSCREVDKVYNTIEMLYQVVQYANVAFFSGDLTLAYNVLRDSLRLFTRLENSKAIAVASNNLGNTMLTIYRTMKVNDETVMCGMSVKDVVEKGMAYHIQSIKLGEEAYDNFYNEQSWSEPCLAFMQYLANRYFNRAIFLLTTSASHENPADAVALGFRDLQIAHDMDVEIVDQCVEMGFRIDRVERHELMISRVRGLLALVKIGYTPEELFLDDQITDLYQDLAKAMANPSHELFKEVCIAGRMQKLDTELIKYFRDAKQDNINAAKVAIRMLVEDEYLFHDAELEATKMLVSYMNEVKLSDKGPADEDCHNIAKELATTVEKLEHEYYIQRSSFLRSSLQVSWSGRNARLSSRSNEQTSKKSVVEEEESVSRRSSAHKISVMGDFTMEKF